MRPNGTWRTRHWHRANVHYWGGNALLHCERATIESWLTARRINVAHFRLMLNQCFASANSLRCLLMAQSGILTRGFGFVRSNKLS
jgi:hypothetical protein